MSDRPIIGVTVGTPFKPNNMSGGAGGVALEDVLQELNNRTDNEPNKVYSANVINKDIVESFTRYITQILGNLVTEIDLTSGYEPEQYPSVDAVRELCLFIINIHREEVNKQLADLKTEIQGDLDKISDELDEIGDLIGGEEETDYIWLQKPAIFEEYTLDGETKIMAVCNESIWDVPPDTYLVSVTMFDADGTGTMLVDEGELTEVNASNPKVYSLSCGSDKGIGTILFGKASDTDTVTYIDLQDMDCAEGQYISIKLSPIGGAE